MADVHDPDIAVAVVWRYVDGIPHAVVLRAGTMNQSEEERYDLVALCGRMPHDLMWGRKVFTDDPEPRCVPCQAAVDRGHWRNHRG